MSKKLTFGLTVVVAASLFVSLLFPAGANAAQIDYRKPFPLVLLEQEGIEENPFEPYFNPYDSLVNIKINSDATNQVQNEEQVSHNRTNPDNLVAVWRDFRLGYRRLLQALRSRDNRRPVREFLRLHSLLRVDRRA